MRVSAQTKLETRQTILKTARRLFADHGFDDTPTRDIARAAGIATGTLFNYFQTKEAIVAALAAEAIGDTQNDSTTDQAESLEEALFSLIATGLRKLKPLRKHLPALLETVLNPLVTSNHHDTALRVAHLNAVSDLALKHLNSELSPTALQLYWTLYTGILVFWANDKSPKQEDTLALVDDSLNMFATWLRQDHPTDTQPRPR